MNNIVLSDIIVEKNGNGHNIKRDIYVNCMCGDINHIGRVRLEREFDENMTTLSMILETNAKSYIKRDFYPDKDGINKIIIPIQYLKWKISEISRKIKLIFAILFKEDIYIPVDWNIMDNTISDFAIAIKTSVDQINKKSIEQGE
jgi:hypothetical protein